MQQFLKRHQLGLITITLFVASLMVYLPGYDYGVPFYHNDEAWFLEDGLARRGVGDLEVTLRGNPPGIVLVYDIGYLIYQSQIEGTVLDADPQRIIDYLRFVVVIFNAMTVVIIFHAGNQFFNRWIGLLASVAWLAMPMITFRTLVVFREPFLVFFFSLTMLSMILALKQESWRWALLATLTSLLAIFFKYSEYPMLGMGVGVSLYFIVRHWRNRSECWRWLATLGAQVMLIAMMAWALFAFFDAGYSFTRGGEASRLFEGGLLNILDPAQLLPHLEAASTRTGVSLPIFLVITLIGGAIAAYKAPVWQRLVYGFTLSLWFVNQALILTYMIYTSQSEIKYTMPSTGMGVILLAFGLYGFYQVARRFMKQPILINMVAVGVLAVWLVPNIIDQFQMTYRRTQVSTFDMMRNWANDTIVGTGTVYLDELNYERLNGELQGDPIPWLYYREADIIRFSELRNIQEWRMFDRVWGGYTGATIPWTIASMTGAFMDRTVDEWREVYVHYLILNDDELIINDYFAPIRENLLPLKAIPNTAQVTDWRGPDMVIYRLWRMEVARDETFEDGIAFVGYDLNMTVARAGDVLQFTPYWQAKTQPAQNYNVYLHFTPVDSRDVMAQADGTPVRLSRPTTSWDDADETLVGADFSITLPDDLPAGEYRLLMGLYNYETGDRLLAEDGNDFITISTITIE